MIIAWIPFQDVTIDISLLYLIENRQNWIFCNSLIKFCEARIKNVNGLFDFIDEQGKHIVSTYIEKRTSKFYSYEAYLWKLAE